MKFSPKILLNEANSSILITHLNEIQSEIPVTDAHLFQCLQYIDANGTDRDFSFINSINIPAASLYEFFFFIDSLIADSFVRYHLVDKKSTIATILPQGEQFKLLKSDRDQKYKLSRFVWINFKDGKTFIECPKGFASLCLEDKNLIQFIYELQSPKSAREIASSHPEINASLFYDFFDMLLSMDALSSCNEQGISEEERDVNLMKWEFHDLLLLTQSRMGRIKKGMGCTFRFTNIIPPISPLDSYAENLFINLPKPLDLEKRNDTNLNFFHVVEKRASIREPSSEMMNLEELSTFLWYVARVKEKKTGYENTEKQHIVMKKPVPGGGGLHEINLYLIINRVKDIESGFYFYEPFQHKLKKISDINQDHRQMIYNSKGATGAHEDPDVMITLSAKFGRISWKYESIALSIILKNAGVLYNQMYLVGTALNLHPCGVGGGNSDLFSKAIQSNYYEETSVGEFILSK